MSRYEILDGPTISELKKALFHNTKKKRQTVVFTLALKNDAQENIEAIISSVSIDECGNLELVVEGRTTEDKSRSFFANYFPKKQDKIKGTLNFYMEPVPITPLIVQVDKEP